jgi:hypothetical protein
MYCSDAFLHYWPGDIWFFEEIYSGGKETGRREKPGTITALPFNKCKH